MRPPGTSEHGCYAAGMMDCVRKTIQWEGPTGLYKVLVLLQLLH